MKSQPSLRLCLLIGAASAALTPPWAAKPTHADPGNDYMLQCQGCHMADGSGSPESVPDLRGHLGLFLGVQGGREFLIRVPGSAQSPLTNSELAEVLNWMIREFGPVEVSARFVPFTAEEIALNRRPLVDVEPVRKILMERIASPRSPAFRLRSTCHRLLRKRGAKRVRGGLAQAGRNTHKDICESLEFFAREVMPEFHDREKDNQECTRAVLAGELELESIDTGAHAFRRPKLPRDENAAESAVAS